MSRFLKILYGSLIIGTFLMAGAAYWMISSLVSESKRIEDSARDTLIGITSQTDYELLKFIDTLYRLELGENSVTREQLINQQDILWSRHSTNTSGKAGATYLALPGARKAMSDLLAILEATEKEIVDVPFTDKERIKRLISQYRPLIPTLHSVTTEAIRYRTGSIASLHDHLQHVGFWAQIFLPGMLLSGFFVSLILRREHQKLNRLARNLEETIQSRTQDLQDANQALVEEIEQRKEIEQKLVQAQKMETIGQLTGGIAHDFNNFLAIIQGNAELLEDELDSDLEKMVKSILKATERGAELTQRLLAFSRQQPLRPQQFNYSDLISNIYVLLKRTVGETISLDVSIEDGLWDAVADPGQVENALINLLINSRHAMPKGGKIRLQTRNFIADEQFHKANPELPIGDYVILCVSDTGTGIPEDIQPHVFEPFFTTKKVGEGTGLGLSMIYGFARQSGGIVTLYSDAGKGTTVELILPKGDSAKNNQPLNNDGEEAITGDNQLVLVVEDEPDVRHLAENILTSLNYRTRSAKDANEAVRILEKEKEISLILCDVVLPDGKNGPEFFDSISMIYPDVKVVFMSGYPAEVAKRRKLISAHHDLLSKPFQRHRLAHAIHKALNKARVESPAAN
ncbi:response regulator [Sneathiella sp.]|uniref:response regulator n=1 Tax=Sneathiella sp. TaxID=1964365 RepID=UPI0039E65211